MQDIPDDNEQLPLPDLDQAALRAHEALTALYHQVCQDLTCTPGHDMPPTLNLMWSPAQPPGKLAELLIQQLKGMVPDSATIQRGRVYCYHCGMCTCEHVTPEAAGEVFAGYANNGTPIWRELFNQLLALSENRVDRLFDDQPAVLARIVGRKSLSAEQTQAYGRDSMIYRIIAQVIAGYFTISRTRCAMTVQIVETPDHALHVQVLLPPLLAEHVANTQQANSLLYRIHDGISMLKRSVHRLQVQWQRSGSHAERMQLQEQLYSMLRKLVSQIEQKDRQGKRRTQHAEERGKQQRPVHKAAEDVAAANAGDFYADTVRQSKVVVGRAGRCHVFNDDGRHITSLQLTGDKLERRMRTKRYVPLPKDDVETLRPAILNYSSDESAE